MNEIKSWIDVEMDETMAVLRKKLEELNSIPADELDHEDVMCMKSIYKTIYYIKTIRNMPKGAQ